MQRAPHIRIATRASPLALWQAERAGALISETSGATIDILPLTTAGDRNRRDAPLGESGGKGLFVGELEAALADGRADVAVHSMKDVPTVPPEGFAITTIGARADARDALIAGARTFDALPDGARVGSSSPRRRAQLLFARPDLVTVPVRGNVGTRLARLDAGDVDALVLACAGLDRLGLGDRISQRLPVDLCLPPPGQGALALEYATGHNDLAALLAPAMDTHTERAVAAERALTRALGADCTTPLGAYATVDGDGITLRATLLGPEGDHARSVADTGTDPRELGERLAGALLRLGAVVPAG
ncbi:MAG: hydroxymethylbilane synthase [Gammaproteobacteria bacterium]|nr:hydroxymethylbilane synthase [Gammaproteobacteria bacterium]